MSEVLLTINGRQYEVSCEDGQEEHLRQLARVIDERVAELVASLGQVGEPRLLVMASLLIADELSDAYAHVDALESARRAAGEAVSAEVVDQAADALEGCAGRLEAIAARLEAT